jgi:hypothetical protein
VGQEHLERVRRAVAQLADAEEERYLAIADAVSHGHTNVEVGEHAGVSGARISQIMTKGARPGPERAFWGARNGSVTVAVGEKTEAPKAASGPLGPVLTVEAREAVDFLRTLTDRMSLDIKYESIPPESGFVKLNRDGLVVICGPRLSPHIAEVLESDDDIRFAKEDNCWFIEDRRGDRVWRSPMDTGVMSDIGYLGRLPRPDGKGNFLYIGGIHGAGTSGVAHYLLENLPDLWREVRTARFSALIRCTLTPAHSVESSELIAGPYLHER